MDKGAKHQRTGQLFWPVAPKEAPPIASALFLLNCLERVIHSEIVLNGIEQAIGHSIMLVTTLFIMLYDTDDNSQTVNAKSVNVGLCWALCNQTSWRNSALQCHRRKQLVDAFGKAGHIERQLVGLHQSSACIWTMAVA